MNERIKNSLSIIIPVYNEELTIGQLMRDILKYYADSEIIVVNDGSTDETSHKLREFNVKVLTHDKNNGYGAALKTGIQNATKDIIGIIDADGTYLVKDIKLFISHMNLFHFMPKYLCNFILEKKIYRALPKSSPIFITAFFRLFNKAKFDLYTSMTFRRYLYFIKKFFTSNL